VQEALAPSDTPSDKARAVITAERLSRASRFGWESPQFKKVLKEVSEYKGVDLEQSLQEIKKAADKASKIAIDYGAAKVCPMIPSSVDKAYFREKEELVSAFKPNPQVQLNILRELGSAAKDGIDVNTIFQMVLEGMHRGVGLERVAVGLINGHKVQAKYALGEGVDHWRESFLFDVGPYTDNVFTYAIENSGSVWVSKETITRCPELFPDDVGRILGKQPCLVFILKVGSRNAAVFYADRGLSGEALNQEQYDSFKHFADQAQFNLNLLSGRKAS
jgi:hypothetical protein